jgi:GntR family transcriptional regulator
MERIERGGYPAGEPLPSERVLASELAVSRTTVRHALLALQEQGLVRLEAARGWFVTSMLSEPPNELVSFSEMARARGLTPSAKVLRQQHVPATIDDAEQLQIAPGAEVFELVRLRFLDGIAVAIAENRVPRWCAPDLHEHDFATESLFAVLEEHYGTCPARADFTVQAHAAQQWDADLLEIDVGDPVLVCWETTFDVDDRPIELAKITYRGDRYRVHAAARRRWRGGQRRSS